MIVTITLEDVATVNDEGSVISVTGSSEDGRRVTFAGGHREMGDVINALVSDVEDEITVYVEGWQILHIEEPV